MSIIFETMSKMYEVIGVLTDEDTDLGLTESEMKILKTLNYLSKKVAVLSAVSKPKEVIPKW